MCERHQEIRTVRIILSLTRFVISSSSKPELFRVISLWFKNYFKKYTQILRICSMLVHFLLMDGAEEPLLCRFIQYTNLSCPEYPLEGAHDPELQDFTSWNGNHCISLWGNGRNDLNENYYSKKIMLMKFSEIWSLTFLSLSLRNMSVYVLVSSWIGL